jgi:hypothetical protein
MNDTNILALSYLDEDLPTIQGDDDLLQRVTQEINAAADSHDVERATAICSYFYRGIRLAGKSLSQALYSFWLRWEDFGIGEDFVDYIHARLGITEHTVDRYLRVAHMLAEADIPSDVKDIIQEKGMQQLIPIAHAYAQGYEITDEQWEKLAQAHNHSEVAQVVNRDIKNTENRENALTITLSRTGSIMVRKGNGPTKFVGSLEIGDEHPEVQAAISRIIGNSGILKT